MGRFMRGKVLFSVVAAAVLILVAMSGGCGGGGGGTMGSSVMGLPSTGGGVGTGQGTASIMGDVLSKGSGKLPGIAVSLQAAGSASNSLASCAAQATTDGNGHFVMDNLAPGEYGVIAMNGTEEIAFSTVELRDRSTISLTMNEGTFEYVMPLGYPFREPEQWRARNDSSAHAGPGKYALDFNRSDDRGKDILAAEGGALYSSTHPKWGNFVVIDHGKGYRTRYAHLESKCDKPDGTRVSRGEPIGKCGDSGSPGQVHLHFQLEKSGSSIAGYEATYPLAPYCAWGGVNDNGPFITEIPGTIFTSSPPLEGVMLVRITGAVSDALVRNTAGSAWQNAGRGGEVSVRLAAGTYEVSVTPVAGYLTPENQTHQVLPGANKATVVTMAFAPEAGPSMESVGRTTQVAFSAADANGTLFAVHTGQGDRRIYCGRRTAPGVWQDWNPALPDCGTVLPVSVAYWRGKLVLAFRSGYQRTGEIWVGTMNPDRSNWSGWRSTGRSSTHAPALASDGSTMYLVHKGSGNNCIYASADAPWFTNGWGEPGGPRTTVDRPAAAVADGHLFIAHRGESNSRVYVKDVTADPSPFNWIDSGRDTPTGPSIAVLNSEVWIGHQGLDGRNYAARLGSASWPSLGESTSVEPFLVVFQGKVGYCYVLNDMMRIDWLP